MCTCLSNDQYEPFVDYIKTFLHLPTDFYAAVLDFRMTKKKLHRRPPKEHSCQVLF